MALTKGNGLGFAPRSIQLGAEAIEAALSLSPFARSRAYAANWAVPNVVPGITVAQTLYRNGWIGWDEYKSWAFMLGCDPKIEGLHGYNYENNGGRVSLGSRVQTSGDKGTWATVFWDQAWIPSIGDAVSLYLRGLVSGGYLDHVYKRNGINTPELLYLAYSQHYQFPSQSTIAQWQKGRHFYAPDRDLLGLDAGYDPNSPFVAWARSAGAGPVIIIDDNGTKHEMDGAEELWASHWTLPSLRMADQFLWRLRPDGNSSYLKQNPGVQPFTEADYDAVLRAHGYSPAFNDRVKTLRYNVPQLRHIQRLVSAGKLTNEEILDTLQCLGFRPDFAVKMMQLYLDNRYKKLSLLETREFIERGIIGPDQATDAVAKLGYDHADADRILSIPRKTLSEGQVMQMVTRGLMDRDEALKRFKWMGFDSDDAIRLYEYARDDRSYGDARQAISQIKEAYRLGVINRETAKQHLISRGNTAEEVELAISHIDLQVRMEHVKTAVKAIQKGYLTAHWTEGTARGQLQRLGIDPTVIDRYISEWNLSLTARYRELSASKNVDAFKRGLISADTLATRLSALGYAADDIHLLSLSGLQDVAKSNSAAALKASRSVAAQQRAARQQLVAVLREKKQAERDLARHGSPAQIAKWFAQGLIPEKLAYARLRQLEWPDEDIARLLVSAALPAKPKQPSAKSTSGQKTTGGGNPPPVSGP